MNKQLSVKSVFPRCKLVNVSINPKNGKVMQPAEPVSIQWEIQLLYIHNHHFKTKEKKIKMSL